MDAKTRNLLGLLNKPFNEELNESAAKEAISSAAGYAFRLYTLESGTGMNRPNGKTSNIPLQHGTKMLQAVDAVVSKRYVDALVAIKNWVRVWPGSDATEADIWFLSILYLVISGQEVRAGEHEEERSSFDEADRVLNDIKYVRAVRNMGLSNRALNVVERCGCETSEDIAAVGKEGLKRKRGCGSSTLDSISKAMRDCGYNW